jgi:hypothetical protein
MTREDSSAPPGGRTFFRIRVAILLSILCIVLLWAGTDIIQRRERAAWDSPLKVALVLVELDALPEGTIDLLRDRVPVLEAALEREFQRYRSETFAPVAFQTFGPVAGAPPPEVKTSGAWDAVTYTYEKWRALRAIDEAAGVHARAYDSRLYVYLHGAAGKDLVHVEGSGEQGGRVGMVEVELDQGMVDLSLFVAAHELFHTLGATDKYDAAGRTRIPEGLVEPDREPLFPQPRADVMARKRLLSESDEVSPETLEELGFGRVTASVIVWTR